MTINIAPELEQYREHIELIAVLLELPVVHAVVCSGGSHASPRTPTYIYIDLADAVKGYSVPEIIAHEMRHCFQYQRGWLRSTSVCYFSGHRTALWKGRLVEQFARTQAEYEQLPWEKDAIEWSAFYLQEYCGQRKAEAA